MDHNAIICSMIDRLARGPDQDVHAPSVGSTKVPFSWCRCHLLVVDYRWGSMGSDETATATTGGSRVIPYLTGTGRHRVQIAHFFRMQIGSRTRSGIGLGSGSRRRRMRPCLGLSRELWIQKLGGIMGQWDVWRKRPCHGGDYRWKRPRMRRRRLHMCSTDPKRPRGTSGPRIDRIPPTRPPWRRRQFRELKKLIFSAPRKCPIDLFGPRANRTPLKQRVCAFRVCMLVSYTAIPGSCAIELDCRYHHQIVLRGRRSHASTPANAPLPHCICIGILIAG